MNILNTFKVEPNADASEAFGTSLQGYIEASYKELEEILGKPVEFTDGYKVSTEWIFRKEETRQVVTLYDYKEVNTYDSSLPTVEEFRKLKSYNWHIGTIKSETARDFRDWLSDLLQEYRDIQAIPFNKEQAKDDYLEYHYDRDDQPSDCSEDGK